MSLPRRKRVRRQGFDYSTPGCYFVTINAQTRGPWFGSVSHGLVHSNAAKQMVVAELESLPVRYPGIDIDAFVVMPDHLHAIIMLGTDPNVSKTPALSKVVGEFKSITSLAYGQGVREAGWPAYNKFFWHRSFRDTIIKTEAALKAFRAYIEAHPGRWTEKHGL